MSQPQSQVLPQPVTGNYDRRRVRRPFAEAVAGWSVRHRKTAVFGWLIMVAVIFVAGQALGTKSVPVYDAGQSGQAEQALHRLGVTAPAVEDVLIQARAPGRTFAADPAMRRAAAQVATALARLPGAATDIRVEPFTVAGLSGFGQDSQGNLYLMSVSSGDLYELAG